MTRRAQKLVTDHMRLARDIAGFEPEFSRQRVEDQTGKVGKFETGGMQRAGQFAYEHRRLKKRTFRALWITRINAAARLHGLSYSALIAGLKKANVEVNRKLLADLAVRDAGAFAKLAEVAKAATA